MSTENQSVCAVVVAAGSSRRMGGENKLLLPLCGKPVLAHTLTAFQMCGAVRDIVLVCREQDMEVYRTLAAENGITKLRTLTRGGDTRTESVLAGVSAASEACALVAVHDGARPLILPEQVDDMVRLGQRTYGAAPALPVTDTVKVADMAGLVQSTPDRKTLYAVQTPQVFQANILKAALQSAIQAGADITDDCSAVERLGKEVWLAPGWRENIKITTREDLTMAEAFLRERENRA